MLSPSPDTAQPHEGVLSPAGGLNMPGTVPLLRAAALQTASSWHRHSLWSDGSRGRSVKRRREAFCPVTCVTAWCPQTSSQPLGGPSAAPPGSTPSYAQGPCSAGLAPPRRPWCGQVGEKQLGKGGPRLGQKEPSAGTPREQACAACGEEGSSASDVSFYLKTLFPKHSQ